MKSGTKEGGRRAAEGGPKERREEAKEEAEGESEGMHPHSALK